MNDNSQIALLTSDIVSSYVSTNAVEPSDLASVIASVSATLIGLRNGGLTVPEKAEPAVPIRSSIGQDYMICLEDGMKFKSLTRHLRERYGMTPEEYRTKWGLPFDYPMVAPGYAKLRSAIARETGLGRAVGRRRGGDVQSDDVQSDETADVPATDSGVVENVAPEVETQDVQTDAATTDVVETTDTLAALREQARENPSIVETEDGLICLEDGRTVKDLGRHLSRHYGLSSSAYREKFGLPSTSPMKFKGR